MIISITENGYIKRSSPRSYMASQSLSISTNEDKVVDVITSNTKDKALVFFDDGTYVIIPVLEINETKWKETGKHISSIAKTNDGVKVVGIISTSDFKAYTNLITTTTLGYTTKVKFEELDINKLRQKIVWQKLKSGDKVVSIDTLNGNGMESLLGTNIIFITNLGRYIKVNSDELEEYQVKRMGKRIGTLRKGENLESVMVFNSETLLISNQAGYIRLSDESVPNIEKFGVLFNNIKSSPQEIILYTNKNCEEFVLVSEEDEKILFFNQLKKCSVEDRIKASGETGDFIACETLIALQEKI